MEVFSILKLNQKKCATTSRNVTSAKPRSKMVTSADTGSPAYGKESEEIGQPASTASNVFRAVRVSEGTSAVMPVERKPSSNFEMPHLSQWKSRYLPPQSTPKNYTGSRMALKSHLSSQNQQFESLHYLHIYLL